MIRLSLLVVSIVAMLATGCCGPMGCGPGCGAVGASCNDCDGLATRMPGATPLDSLRNLKRDIICGGGCGETYYGEWMSTPPDCTDPCMDSQWVGGATPAQPFCWSPGTLLGGFRGLMGQRFCDGCGNPYGNCACGGGDCGCAACVDDACASDFSLMGDSGACGLGGNCGGGSSGGCSTCAADTGTRIARQPMGGMRTSGNRLAQSRRMVRPARTAAMPRMQTQQTMPMYQTQVASRSQIQTGIQTGVQNGFEMEPGASQMVEQELNQRRSKIEAQLREARAIQAELEQRLQRTQMR